MIDIESKLKELLKNCIEEDIKIENIKLDDKFDEFGMNSLSFIKLVVAIETEFCIEFSDEDLNIDKYLTFGNLVDYIKSKLD